MCCPLQRSRVLSSSTCSYIPGAHPVLTPSTWLYFIITFALWCFLWADKTMISMNPWICQSRKTKYRPRELHLFKKTILIWGRQNIPMYLNMPLWFLVSVPCLPHRGHEVCDPPLLPRSWTSKQQHENGHRCDIGGHTLVAGPHPPSQMLRGWAVVPRGCGLLHKANSTGFYSPRGQEPYLSFLVLYMQHQAQWLIHTVP